MDQDPRNRLGALGEQMAQRHLEARGYWVIERNFRTRYGELDLVVADGEHLVFCEVKTRILRGSPGPFGPLTAVGARKRRRVRLMAREWLAVDSARERPRPPAMRFDAVGITVLTVLLAVVLVVKGHRRAAVLTVVVTLVALAATQGVKALLGRDRPQWQWEEFLHQNGSYPSGHAAHTTALAGVCLVLVVMLVRRANIRRLLGTGLAGIVIKVRKRRKGV